VLFVIDDGAGVVHALRDDLGRRFGEDFRVIGESSAPAGLAVLRQLADEREPVALLIVDHDMTEMAGVDFLARAHELHPLARRVLLVERDYSARSPVVQAMTLDGRCLCRIRGPADGRAGRERFRRPGGKQSDDPELSGLPARHQRT
jgi:DNA-binding NarL/FixJ family response regulator